MVDEKLASVPPVPGLGSEAIPRDGTKDGTKGENESSSRRKEKREEEEEEGAVAAEGRGGRRQIRNEFFCFEHPEKRSNVRENDPRLLLLGVAWCGAARRGAAWRGRATQRRGKRRESEFGARPARVRKPFLQPCMQPVQHESHKPATNTRDSGI